jgi:hypothetical protein
MSQIASFTVLKASDVPHLGFWSKPKPRLFRKPENMFDALLRPHVLREQIFGEADGAYVALVFAWIDSLDKGFSERTDTVVDTLRKNLGGSHWLLKSAEVRLVALLGKPLADSEWPTFLRRIDVENGSSFEWSAFETARLFVRDRLSELKPNEAMLVAIG